MLVCMFVFRLTPVLADGQKKPDDSLAGGAYADMRYMLRSSLILTC